MGEFSDKIDKYGIEFKLQMEKKRVEDFPFTAKILFDSYNIKDDINELEAKGYPILKIFEAFYNVGYYKGINFTIDNLNLTESKNF